ncbi:peptidoglycan-binding protein [Streptomyces sp. NRRL WC-3626]|uniref:peptidoglycan-binding protein n=1 Tax=Streptomyces sp. NRRL WC-3626 TaxID=1463926 RepID=UPI0004BF8D69|nr:peptidoglycan-binding protein [Streptomyces sp. NRRL WC-3626]
MAVTIHRRSTWAVHVPDTSTGADLIADRAATVYWDYEFPYRAAQEAIVAQAGMGPLNSGREWTPWKGGVFIHHRGLVPRILNDEDDCRRDIAEVWAKEYIEDFDDIEYNFLVCPHGHVYEGRGLQRGEANSPGYIRESGYGDVGRNTGYYSICGLLWSTQQPTSAMKKSIRDLIWHLRTAVPDNRKAGDAIYPHSKNNPGTDCPGNLTSYAKTGSDIDPGMPAPSAPAQLDVISRSQWNARPPRQVVKVPYGQRVGFAVHYSAGNKYQTVRAIQNYHMDSNGWDDIGYNFLVDWQGRIYEGRGWTNLGAHVAGYNTSHIGVCFIGVDGDATTEAKNAIRSLYHAANERTGRTLNATYHSALAPTQCPGAELRLWVVNGMSGSTLPIGDSESGTPGMGETGVRSVIAQQRAVNGLGHTPPLDEDGVFGPLTGAGVKWLQTKVGTDPDGLWGPATEAAYVAYIGRGGGGGGVATIRSVSAQQRAVNGLGYTPALATDGIFGPLTETGVKWLQSKVGTAPDGMWGPDTERAYADHTGSPNFSGGGITTIRAVRAQQRAVNGLGHTPPLDEDGVFGPLTEAGVKWLQGKVGAAADGLWGPATEAAYTAYSDGERLPVDGEFGPATITATQRAIGVTADGEWGPASKRALQQHLNTWAGAELVVDGDIGAATVEAMQRHLNKMTGAGLLVDGDWGTGTTKALQAALNQGRF